MTEKEIKAPKYLKKATKDWFNSVINDYELEPHHIRLLTLAAEAWDRCEDARKVIAKLGMTYQDRFGCPKPRPEVAIEAECRIAFARLVRELNLDIEAPKPPGRPPGLY